MDFHTDTIIREEVISKYLHRRLGRDAAAEFESHYLGCDDCYQELRASELLIHALGQPLIARTQLDDVTVLRFAGSAQLTGNSLAASELLKAIHVQNDTKVLIDLSQVSRIDSAGLGMLMNCYCHALNNSGALKLLNPTAGVKKVLNMTRIDSVVPTFDDESTALRSFSATAN